ncbi:rho family-interacting cell polarization regulator 1-like [Brachionichthys hirsutus]|uniref:rho family-interacting cell polarization regulator 1-like n=1 Tax=Brachionichthys hirsutus TaxID=412623 RepID=UPI003605117B
MYSGYGGSPSRTLSTMSLSIRPVRRPTSRSITRSQSFTGVNSYDKPYRNLLAFSTPGLSRKPSRASRMFTMSTKPNPPPKVPQPDRLDQVYQALKKGLQCYLQVHQLDLDNLGRQMKESKRNSRLGFLYELDKIVKVTERLIRRLEFHLSKIEELYEAYCLQRRLRDGANKMVKAYGCSPCSKEARESLVEASKGYKEYTENMCVLESELENQLGEFHIKMKGLAGFARLCAGDQYEIFMKYGRQRWKLRGRIELNNKQVWDSEDMVFLPLISDFLSVKVTELKSLANHVIVGSVSCETKDLFAALPQAVAVDINDLGTIKLSLEVTWNPFDKDDQSSVPSTVSKAPSVSKRFSTIFNQSPPDTPSLREQAFYNMLRRHDELENGTAWSNSSESSDDSSSPQLPAGGGLRSATQQTAVLVTPDIRPVVTGSPSPQRDVSLCPRDVSSTSNAIHSVTETPQTSPQQAASNREEEEEEEEIIKPDGEEEDAAKPVDGLLSASRGFSRSLSHISEGSTDGLVLTDMPAGDSEEVLSPVPGLSTNDVEMEASSRTPEPPSATTAALRRLRVCEEHKMAQRHQNVLTPCSPRTGGAGPGIPSQMKTLPEGADVTYVARRVSVEEDLPSSWAGGLSGDREGVLDCTLGQALGALVSSLDDYRGQFPELQLLEHELELLQVTLQGGTDSRSPSMASLTVETALGSFDFLDTSDWEDEAEECSGDGGRNGRALRDTGWDSPSSPCCPLTTGCAGLDCTLLVHLKYCSTQLLRLGTFGPLRCGEMYALDRLLREARVLEAVRRITKDSPSRPRRPAEVVPELDLCLGAVSLWQHCVGQGDVYSVHAESLLVTLSTFYSSILPGKASNMVDRVFLCLVEQMLCQRLPRRCTNKDSTMVTLFQLWMYLEANSINDMGTHIVELAEEVCLVESLASCDQDVIVHALRRPAECSLRRRGLHAVAKLLKDPRGKVSASASSVLRSLVMKQRHREQALVSCLELLEDDDMDTRVCGCKALACLTAKESIDHLVYLCQTDTEEVRAAAKQALLVLGEEGKMAYRHVETSQDSIPKLFAPGSMASTAF